MFRIRSKKDVFLLALFGAVVASTASACMIYLTLPADRAVGGAIRAVICAAVVSLPMIAVFAQKIRENQELSENLRYLIDHDRLTDVATRDSFFQQVRQKGGKNGIVMMLDIDHFKRINDTFGHMAGDQVIRAVAQAVDTHTRSTDVIARFGGEEFVVYVDCQDVDLGGQIAERLRRTVEWTEVLSDTGQPITPTVSIGVAPLTTGGSVDHAIKAADDALYQAKRNGRNATWIAGSGRFKPSVETGGSRQDGEDRRQTAYG